MQRDPRYDDVVAEVHGHLLDLAAGRPRAGVGELWVDPGIGFGKTVEHNLALLAHVGELVDAARAIGGPGAGRHQPNKWFLGVMAPGGGDAGPGDRAGRGHDRDQHLGHDPGRAHGAGPRRRPGGRRRPGWSAGRAGPGELEGASR